MALARIETIFRAGLDAVNTKEVTPEGMVLLRAVAGMIAVATGPKRRAVTAGPKLAVTPQVLFEAVKSTCPDRIICEPVDVRWFGRLGGALKALPDFVPSDVELLTSWLSAGGQASWPQGVPTFGHLITHLASWTGFARLWDQRGRQTIGGKNVVGAAGTAESTDFSAFGRKLQ